MLKQKAFTLGLLSSFFFSFTFLLNRSMSLVGGNFLWSASLRYIYSLPFFIIYLGYKKRLRVVHTAIRNDLFNWFLWSFVGFILFYVPLTFASNYGSSWLVAASWQFTIVAGTLMTPLFGHKIPKRNLYLSILILIGVFLLQFNNLASFKIEDITLCLLPVIIAAIAYPLGNRKMMSICPKNLNTLERIYGMTLCTFPFWVIFAIIAYFVSGVPTLNQNIQSLLVAIFSALIATILFFHATDIVNHNPKLLSLVESTIAGEVVFTLIGGIFLLHDNLPSFVGWIGLIIIVIGMILNSKHTK